MLVVNQLGCVKGQTGSGVCLLARRPLGLEPGSGLAQIMQADHRSEPASCGSGWQSEGVGCPGQRLR